MDNLLLPTEEENGTWRIQDWHWDPYKMEAEPVERRPSSSRRQSRGPVVCQVENCGADLSGLKEYHQRYKICEYHLKVSSIVKDSTQQRFCQQCGRFHVLSEFDGVKRSCRARLERHNARRRKKSDGQTSGSKVRSGSQCKDEKTPPSSGEYDMDVDVHSAPTGEGASLSSGDPRALPLVPHVQVPLGAAKDSLMEQYFYNDEDACMASEPPRQQVDAMPLEAAPIATVHEDGDPVAEVFRNFATSTEARELFSAMARNELMAREGNQNPSLVALSEVLFPSAERSLPGRPMGLHSAPRPPTFPGTPIARRAGGPEFHSPGPMGSHAGMPQGLMMQDVKSAEGRVEDAGALQQAAANAGVSAGPVPFELLDQGVCATFYDSLLKLTSLSIKVFNCTPGNLPTALRRELLNAVRGGLVPEGYMRPGCVQLTLDVARERGGAGEGGSVAEAVEGLLEGEEREFWRRYHLLFQLEDQVVIVREGAVIQSFSREDKPDLFPVVQRPTPFCILNEPGAKFTLQGKGISGLQDTLFCRVKGRYVPIDVDYDAHEEVEGVEAVECELLEECQTGALRIEAAHMGMLSSEPRVVLAVRDPQIVAEVRSLETENTSDEALDSWLHDMGRVLEFRDWVLARYSDSAPAEAFEEAAKWEYTVEEMAVIVRTARRLVGFALGRSWTAVTEAVLPVAMLGPGAVAEVASLCKASCVDLPGWMHLAEESEKRCMVSFLQQWAMQAGSSQAPVSGARSPKSERHPKTEHTVAPQPRMGVLAERPVQNAPLPSASQAICHSQTPGPHPESAGEPAANSAQFNEGCYQDRHKLLALCGSGKRSKGGGRGQLGGSRSDEGLGNVQGASSIGPVSSASFCTGAMKAPELSKAGDGHSPCDTHPSTGRFQLWDSSNSAGVALRRFAPTRTSIGCGSGGWRAKRRIMELWHHSSESLCPPTAMLVADGFGQFKNWNMQVATY